jgi:hypothetical protein
MKWYELALNPQSLASLYKTVPELVNVELFSLYLDREGSRIQILVDLPYFPDYPSTKWNEKFNSVQIQLTFIGVTNFEAKGWQTKMKVKIDIKKVEDKIKVSLSNPQINLNFSFLCDFLKIERISAYQESKEL